jgi:hypothetical protein
MSDFLTFIALIMSVAMITFSACLLGYVTYVSMKKPDYTSYRAIKSRKAYVRGVISIMGDLRYEYMMTENDKKPALRSYILRRFNDFEDVQLPFELRAFEMSLREEQKMERKQ